jgi:hypothetical protein
MSRHLLKFTSLLLPLPPLLLRHASPSAGAGSDDDDEDRGDGCTSLEHPTTSQADTTHRHAITSQGNLRRPAAGGTQSVSLKDTRVERPSGAS